MNSVSDLFNKEHLLIVLIVFIFYGNTLKNDYSLDDSFVTEKNNITAKGISAIPKIFNSFYISTSADYQFDYRPMVKVSYAIEHSLFSVNPKTSHAVNLLLYIIGLLIALRVLKLLFSNIPPPLLFYTVVLFAILPIHTEVVSSLKNRDILLCFIFAMLAFKNFILFAGNTKHLHRLFISMLMLYLGFLSKFDVLPFLLVIPLLVYMNKNASFRVMLLCGILLIGSYVAFKYTQKGTVGFEGSKRQNYFFENPLYFAEAKYRIVAMFNSLGFYINQVIFPFKLCCYYGERTIPVTELSAHGIFGILAAPVLVFGLVKSFLLKDRFLFAGIFIFCASVSMYLNLLRPAVGIVADRFAFFPSLGVAISIIALLMRYKVNLLKPSMNIKLFAASCLVVFGVMTIHRNTEWKNATELVAADVSKYPDNAYLNYKHASNLIHAVQENARSMPPEQQKQQITEARVLLERSVNIEPNYPNSRNFLSYVLIYMINDFKAALVQINASIALKETVELNYYKAICLRETGKKDSAEFFLKKCIAVDKQYYNAYGLLMYDYNAAGNFNRSIDMFNQALEKGVTTESIYLGLAKTFLQMKNTVEAKKYYLKVIELNPSNEEAQKALKSL